ncbi:hypothetical protein KI387_025725, partial [Taxus chinensis]
ESFELPNNQNPPGSWESPNNKKSIGSPLVVETIKIDDIPDTSDNCSNVVGFMPAKDQLMLIDGTPLIYRAYYKIMANLHHGGLQHADGNGDWVLTIFKALSLMLDMLDLGPSHAAVVFDYDGEPCRYRPYYSNQQAPIPKGSTFRHTVYPAYKSNRIPTPDTIVQASQYLKAALKAMSIKVIQVPGVEADDVIGTLAVNGVAAGLKIQSRKYFTHACSKSSGIIRAATFPYTAQLPEFVMECARSYHPSSRSVRDATGKTIIRLDAEFMNYCLKILARKVVTSISIQDAGSRWEKHRVDCVNIMNSRYMKKPRSPSKFPRTLLRSNLVQEVDDIAKLLCRINGEANAHTFRTWMYAFIRTIEVNKVDSIINWSKIISDNIGEQHWNVKRTFSFKMTSYLVYVAASQGIFSKLDRCGIFSKDPIFECYPQLTIPACKKNFKVVNDGFFYEFICRLDRDLKANRVSKEAWEAVSKIGSLFIQFADFTEYEVRKKDFSRLSARQVFDFGLARILADLRDDGNMLLDTYHQMGGDRAVLQDNVGGCHTIEERSGTVLVNTSNWLLTKGYYLDEALMNQVTGNFGTGDSLKRKHGGESSRRSEKMKVYRRSQSKEKITSTAMTLVPASPTSSTSPTVAPQQDTSMPPLNPATFIFSPQPLRSTLIPEETLKLQMAEFERALSLDDSEDDSHNTVAVSDGEETEREIVVH